MTDSTFMGADSSADHLCVVKKGLLEQRDVFLQEFVLEHLHLHLHTHLHIFKLAHRISLWSDTVKK